MGGGEEVVEGLVAGNEGGAVGGEEGVEKGVAENEGGAAAKEGGTVGGEEIVDRGVAETREREGEGEGGGGGGGEGGGNAAGVDHPSAKRPRASDAAADRPSVSAIGMSKSDKAVVGRMVKTLLDTGRLQWLSDRGLAGRLVGYVAPAVSPENRLIVVARRA